MNKRQRVGLYDEKEINPPPPVSKAYYPSRPLKGEDQITTDSVSNNRSIHRELLSYILIFR